MKKRVILLISVSLISFVLGCSIFSACGNFWVPVYGFDLKSGVLYSGQIEQPTDIVKLDSLFVERQWVALKLSDWNAVRQYCNSKGK